MGTIFTEDLAYVDVSFELGEPQLARKGRELAILGADQEVRVVLTDEQLHELVQALWLGGYGHDVGSTARREAPALLDPEGKNLSERWAEWNELGGRAQSAILNSLRCLRSPATARQVRAALGSNIDVLRMKAHCGPKTVREVREWLSAHGV